MKRNPMADLFLVPFDPTTDRFGSADGNACAEEPP